MDTIKARTMSLFIPFLLSGAAAPLAVSPTSMASPLVFRQSPQGIEAHGSVADTLERRLLAMGTWLDLRLPSGPATRAQDLAATELALAAIQSVEQRLSSWRAESELSRLNRTTLESWTPISAEFAADLTIACKWRDETQGAFDPSVGALVHLWGLREGGGAQPKAAAIEACVAGARAWTFDSKRRQVRREHTDALLEAGAFGKGVGLDAACTALRSAGCQQAWLNFGGQLAIVGSGINYEFVVAHPMDRSREAVTLRISHGSLATSGNSERSILVDGKLRGHILDPRSGMPASNFGSLTVWAPDATSADCLSTALYVLGPDAALTWAEARDGIEVLVLETYEGRREPVRVRATSGIAAILKAIEDENPAQADSRTQLSPLREKLPAKATPSH
ncbi:MAG: thiamine biosynthesis lipoprotein [Planctomycetota bacterium]|jgi:thiamine biosynthesis lipoprotein